MTKNTNTHKALSWDGTRKRFAGEAAALAWAREHLGHWMEDDDRLVRWRSAKGNTVIAVSVCGEPSDACVIVGACS